MEGGLVLLRRFTAQIKDPDLDFEIEISVCAHRRRLVVERVTVQRHTGGEPVTGTACRRLTLDAYLQKIRRHLGETSGSFLIAQIREPAARSTRWSPPDPQQWSESETAQRRRMPVDQTLPRVAEVYRAALADPDFGVAQAPTLEVAIRLHYSRGHAARLVSEARKAGLLGPAAPGKAGELKQGELKQ